MRAAFDVAFQERTLYVGQFFGQQALQLLG